MKPIKVLVTGVGAIIGYGIVNNLRKIPDLNLHIVGIDIFPDAVGRHWCDSFIQGVYAQSPEFSDFILSLVKRHGINLIIPGIEQDVDALAHLIEHGKLPSNLVAINSKSGLKVFQNKLNTSLLQAELNIPHIPFMDAASVDSTEQVVKECGLPCIYKPYSAYAGKGLAILHTASEVEAKLSLNEGIFQKYIQSNKEYTVSVFGLDDGTFINPIAFERRLGPDGATHKAKVIDFSLFEQTITLFCQKTTPKGPTNFQFIADDSSDSVFLLEVNPRVSSSTSIRQKFGINEAKMCIEFYLFSKTPSQQTVRFGSAERFIDEVVTYDCDHI
ncbi:ATP-grasp domain-containing protein [Vibrio tubiashii]|uniref:ATP-grasp domain-containing protein n=1 Tax=Vibrio tubiashii TaxID=29498 RepID=UPI001EFEAC80|nr:ATP-grasp domain-containing protein [Vibrio tubiashii]MCG9617732.1 ATP-grasp domain-containing protein [Vibrio tubiashii]MCG9689530.1 ATP-grasp domain-containing protein [Vibrio tubiashii]